jgi:hypothetical protein
MASGPVKKLAVVRSQLVVSLATPHRAPAFRQAASRAPSLFARLRAALAPWSVRQPQEQASRAAF